MTNAVYSCWCFNGARVGGGRGGGGGVEKGSHNMLYRVFEGERWSAVGVGESGFEFVEVGGAVLVEERAKITNRI